MHPALKLPLQYTLALFILAQVSTTAFAEQVYRWVDDKGQVHFGAMPPQKQQQQAEIYNLQVTPPSSTPLPPKKDPQAQQAAEPQSQETELKGSIAAEDAKKYCDEGRNYRSTLSEDFSRRYTQPDGSVRPLTDAERAAEMKKADDIVKRYCGK